MTNTAPTVSMFTRARLAERVFDAPLMMHPGKAAAAARALGPLLTGGAQVEVTNVVALDHNANRPGAGRLGDPGSVYYDRADDAMTVVDGVAVITVEGTLVHKGAWIGSYSGETSYQGIMTACRLAAEDPAVNGIVFEIDSFGGEVAGAFDCAATIRELSAAKPTMAICNDHACSAAYLLASATGQIVAPKSGTIGSIGIITMHADLSGKLANEGIAVTILHAGGRKPDGNPYQPLPDDVAADITANLETIRTQFADAVALGRGNRLTAASALQTEARTWLGSDAVGVGLIDATARPTEAFAAFVDAMNVAPTRRAGPA